ncbi:MAG: hypothetical protein QF714_13270 [Dehalococcoidia bacterium]|nr:hypothetical protein [Dehalococcoidia bacterium]
MTPPHRGGHPYDLKDAYLLPQDEHREENDDYYVSGDGGTHQGHRTRLERFVEADQSAQDKEAYSSEYRPIRERDAVQIGPEHQVGGGQNHRGDVGHHQQPDKTQPSCYNGCDEVRDAESKRREQAQNEALNYHSASSHGGSQQSVCPRLRPSERGGRCLFCCYPGRLPGR